MANGEQMRAAIEHATERLMAQGYDDADLKTVLLAGLGYVATEVRAAVQERPLLRLDGKRLGAVGLGLGGILAGLVQQLWHRFAG